LLQTFLHRHARGSRARGGSRLRAGASPPARGCSFVHVVTIVPQGRFGDRACNCFPFFAILQDKESGSLHACVHAAMPELTERSINFVRAEIGRGDGGLDPLGFFWREGLVLLGPRLLRASACPQIPSAPERRCERAERVARARVTFSHGRSCLMLFSSCSSTERRLLVTSDPGVDERAVEHGGSARARTSPTRPDCGHSPCRGVCDEANIFGPLAINVKAEPTNSAGLKAQSTFDKGGTKTCVTSGGWGWGTRSTSPSTPTS
jgi:hypothetical protein